MNRWMQGCFLVGMGMAAWQTAAAATVAMLKNIDRDIQSVRLDDKGELTVMFWENNCLVRRQLSEATSMRLNFLASTLADATTLPHALPRKCLVIVDPRYVFELSVRSAEESGEAMKTVLTLQSCSLDTYIHPSERQLEMNAYILKEVLWVEAHEAAACQ